MPFWVAMPTSTLDRSLHDGLAEIPIEQRSAREVTHLVGRGPDGEAVEVQLVPDGSNAANPAFDVTPARLVTALITEHGVVPAAADAIGSPLPLGRRGQGVRVPRATRPHPDPLLPAGEGVMRDAELRASLVAAVCRLDALGLNRGSTGNVSARGASDRSGFWITPTGMGAADLDAAGLVWMSDDGAAQGTWQPSSEWPFHRAIYAARPDLAAVVHVHSVHATALSSLRRALPPFHYMVAIAGGDDVPCTPYHLFGSEELSGAVATAFSERRACLMANHGLVAGGTNLAHAMKVTIEIEALCEAYLKALAVGEPALLTRGEMAAVIERFRTYGQARR